jgi:phage terminase large subunit-like protein
MEIVRTSGVVLHGPELQMRDWRALPYAGVDPDTGEQLFELTTAEKVMQWAERHIRVPEGQLVGQPLRIAEFQERFLRAVFDNPAGTRLAVLSMGRKNAKSTTVAIILLAFLCGPVAHANSEISSGAMSRDQAALVFALMEKMIVQSPVLASHIRIIPSGKRLHALRANVRYSALAADGRTAVGRSDRVIIGDEWGQVVGPSNPFVDAMLTSQGAYQDPLAIIISTQAASDADFLSLTIDDAIRSRDPRTVVHLYAAAPNADLLDREAWAAANPALGLFRSESDLAAAMEQAARIPTKESSVRNLLLNQRISRNQLAISPQTWRDNAAEPDLDAFRGASRVVAGLDLSSRQDLTAAVLAAEGADGRVSVLPFVFCPTEGIEARALRDRTPYDVWVRNGQMIPIVGSTMDFGQIAQALSEELAKAEIAVDEIHYDKHMINHFRSACTAAGLWTGAEWVGVPQTFREMGTRLNSLQSLMVAKRVRHGAHPLLNMAASNAVAQIGREGLAALSKSGSTQRIDPLVAMVMACWPFGDGAETTAQFDVSAIIA